MQAFMRSGYGSPDILRLEEVPTPVPGEGQVLVRIRAASLNRADLDYLTGTPAITRMGTGIRRPRVLRVGLDAAGEVEAVGSGVTRFKPGDRATPILTRAGQGAFAEYACASEKAWHRIPPGVDFEAASTVPQSAILALEGLGGRHGVKPGDKVLINGASGCTGPFAVQMAKAAGAEVTGVCRTSKLDFVRSLGVDHILDYTQVDYTRSGQRYDRILDAPGDRSVLAARRALAPHGIYQSFGSTSTLRVLATLVGGPLLSLGRHRTMGIMLAWKPNDVGEMATVGEMLATGIIRPAIDRRYPLAEVPDALRYMAGGEARGKLVITV